MIVGFADVSSAFAATVASSLAGFLPGSVCSAVTFSPWTNLSAGMFSTVHLPSSPTVASPIFLPSLSFNTTVAPATPVPDTLVSPAFGAVIVGFADVSSSAFAATVASTGSDTDLPSSFCVATTVSFSVRLIPAGTSAVHVPSSLTATLLAIGVSSEPSSPFNAKSILDPLVPFPEIV